MSDFEEFYNKPLEIMVEGEGYLDDAGIWHDGVLRPFKTIYCDVQPYTKELAYKDYGFILDCSKRIFCDIDIDLNVDVIVRYRNDLYQIVKLVEWDDYYDIMVDNYKGSATIG